LALWQWEVFSRSQWDWSFFFGGHSVLVLWMEFLPESIREFLRKSL